MIANDDFVDNDYDLKYDSDVDKVPETTLTVFICVGIS